MKRLTKEWVKDFELQELITVLSSKKKVPFAFTNGGTESVAEKDLITVKTDFNLTDKENEISFLILPEVLFFDYDFLSGDREMNDEELKNNLLFQYKNLLRIITYLPDNLLSRVKDKRLLALGYAESEVKKEILSYAKKQCRKAYKIYEKACDKSVEAEQGLTIHKQFEKHPYTHSLPLLFDETAITKAEVVNDKMYLKLDNYTKLTFSGIKILEEEISVENTDVKMIELHKKQDCHELHLLLETIEENFIKNYYYATYAFKDLKMSSK